MGEGWSWTRKQGSDDDHAANAREGWEQVKRDLAAQTYRFYVLDEFTYPMKWGWVDVDEVVQVLRDRPGDQHVVITGRDAAPGARRGRRPRDGDDEGQAPDGRRPEGPAGDRVVTPLPRVVVAAPSSGAGKTTVATGLMAALTARGLQVSPHKVGPDYIDPGYHALATGRPGRNLDPVLVGPERLAPLLLHGARGADVAVVEGVMGLFDGRGSTTEGSTAHVAALLGAPVVLVVDASSMSHSVAALVHGFATYGDVSLAGVVLNRVGSDRHEQLLREALEGRRAGARRAAARRRRHDAEPPPRAWCRPPSGRRRRSRRCAGSASSAPAASTSTRS